MTSKVALTLMALTLIGDGPGWLAQALARTDPDVDAAVAAYENEDWELALEHLDAANDRRGERPELSYDRGLVLLAQADTEGAREAFQRGTESDVPGVLASSHYQLGNLAMMDEDWEAAIAEYIGCLRAQPDHQNAKWNLEIALQRKREQEKKEQEEKDEQEKKDEEKKDEEKKDEEKKDEEKKDEEKQDQEKQDQEKQDQENQDQEKQDQQKQDQEKQDPQKQDPQKQDPAEPQQAKPIETGDLDAALEQLDRQDEFLLGRPRGSRRPVEKDW